MGRGEGSRRDAGEMVKALKGKGLRVGVRVGLRVGWMGKGEDAPKERGR